MLPALLSRAVIVLVGVCYPAYATFKAIRTKRLGEYANWMMYWTVFAPLLCAEPLAESLLGWLPLYYDARAALALWLALPATRGAVFLYRRYAHPALRRREPQIDEYVALVAERAQATATAFCAQAVVIAREMARRAAESFPDALPGEAARAPPPPPAAPPPPPHEQDGNGDTFSAELREILEVDAGELEGSEYEGSRGRRKPRRRAVESAPGGN